MVYNQGEPVEVTLDSGAKMLGRYKMHYPQYEHHEVAFADGSSWIGIAEQLRRPSDDEIIAARGQAAKQ